MQFPIHQRRISAKDVISDSYYNKSDTAHEGNKNHPCYTELTTAMMWTIVRSAGTPWFRHKSPPRSRRFHPGNLLTPNGYFDILQKKTQKIIIFLQSYAIITTDKSSLIEAKLGKHMDYPLLVTDLDKDW